VSPSRARVRSGLLNAGLIVVTMLAGAAVVGNFGRRDDPYVATPVDGWQDLAAVGHRQGPSDAPVTIVVFSDFYCPFCRLAAEDLAELRRSYQDNLAIVYRHFPVSGVEAIDVAQASECAATEGLFFPFHDAVFATDSVDLARTFGDIMSRRDREPLSLEQCLADTTSLAMVRRDALVARDLGLTMTPSFLINHLKLQGYPGTARIEGLVKGVLRETTQDSPQ